MLELGAADAVADSDARHLVLVVQARARARLPEPAPASDPHARWRKPNSAASCFSHGSKAAIAYVHEGMHIFANEVYLKLFGFDDADDLLGLPLIDLLDAEQRRHAEGHAEEIPPRC